MGTPAGVAGGGSAARERVGAVKRSPSVALTLAVAIAVASVWIGLAAGERWLSPWAPGSELDERILWTLRWPRVQTAAAIGALLALAGAWLQTLVGNPLAEPYVLGVAGSSSVGAILGLALSGGGPVAVSISAFAGACLGTAFLLPLARLGANRLLLAGVVMASFWGATVTLALALLSERDLGRALSWMMGDVGANIVPPWVLWVAVAATLLVGVRVAPHLDRLALGDRHAATMGTPVSRLRLVLLLLSSAATGLAVAAVGTVGFVGLVVPHAARMLVGSPHRLLLPVCVAGGATLVVLADAGARTVIAPAELPIGVVTALIGVPVFLWLLLRRRAWAS